MLRIFLAGALIYVIYRQLASREDLPQLAEAFRYRLGLSGQWMLFLGVLLLMPVNWGLETVKWRLFLHPFSRMSFGRAFFSVLIGLGAALLTPARAGEYGGRVLLEESRHRWSGVTATLMGNACQWIIMLLCGLGGGFYFITRHPGIHFPAGNWAWYVLLGIWAVIAILILNLSRIADYLKVLELPQWLSKQIGLLEHYGRRVVRGATALAFLRYLTFCLQFYLLLLFFGVGLDADILFSGMATVFIVQAGIPLPGLAGLVARGELALLLWEPLGGDPLAILAATLSLFIINLALPSLIGIAGLMGIKSFEHEKHNE